MILESLFELVETLKVRIDAHGDQLRQSEALTRYALINPLLRELGWDTGDPALVIPEYNSGGGSADYALLGNGSPVVMVEAKRLGTLLQGSVVSQGIQYCLEEGTEHFAVTDGQRWEVYETHIPVPIDQKKVVDFDLKGQQSAEVCLNALALWRPSVLSGHVDQGHGSVIGLTEDIPAPLVTTDPQSSTPPDGYNWEPLTEITSATGLKPVEMLFPDSSRTQLKYWTYLPVGVVRWLVNKGMLSSGHCPIISRGPKTSHYIVNTQPIHSDGALFSSSSEVNGLYVERHGSSIALLDRTKTIIEHVNQDPAQFSIRFS